MQTVPAAGPVSYGISHSTALPTNVEDDSGPSPLWLHPAQASLGRIRSDEPVSRIRLNAVGGVPASISMKKKLSGRDWLAWMSIPTV